MRGRTWLPTKPKPPSKPKVDNDVREAVDAQAAPVVANKKKLLRKSPKNRLFNWPDDFFNPLAP